MIAPHWFGAAPLGRTEEEFIGRETVGGSGRRKKLNLLRPWF